MRFLFCFFVAFITVSAFSQKSSLNVLFGANYSRIDESLDAYYMATTEKSDYSHKAIFGYNFGILYEYGILKHLSVSTGLIYSEAGQKSTVIITSSGHDYIYNSISNSYVSTPVTRVDTTKSTIRLFYVDLPLQVQFPFWLNSVCIKPYLGYSIGYGFYGYHLENGSFRMIQWGSNDDDDFVRLDNRYTLGVGLQYKRFSLRADYSKSLDNVFPGQKYYNYNNSRNEIYRILIGVNVL